jgi:hypothetical protein
MSHAITVLYNFALACLIYCTIFLTAHVHSYMLDRTEPKLEEPTEQAQAEDPANKTLDQGKPWYILPIILGFFF